MVAELYKNHAQELYTYCLAMTRDPEWAMDIRQEVFLKAMVHLVDLEPLSEKQRRAWLYKASRNLFIDEVRKKKLEQQKAPLLLQEESYEENGFSQILTKEILHTLPPPLGNMLFQRYVLGYNASQLAELYDEPPSTIRYRLMQGRNLLKKQLKEKRK